MPKVQLKVVIIGSGIAGLAVATCLAQKGHDVRVLERKPDLSEFGAGIQIGANGARLLIRWGMTELFENVVYKPDYMEIMRYDNGERIGRLLLNHMKTNRIAFGEEHWLMHRPDYQKALAEAAYKAGAKNRIWCSYQEH